MESREIRRRFLDFFETRGHRRVPSSSLIPNDPTLLLTTAGMVQFKPYLLGLADPPYPRAVSVQKAFRTTDIENVGHTARHMTFFEMLGNFSFGDYFKSEACAWGWELVTEGFGIDPDRIWATVFDEDEESIEIWTGEVGLPRERIVRRGKDDNFWWLPAGPGGPCSEIFVDRGPRHGPDGGPAVDEERFLEIWNLVFMQHEVDEDGNVVGDLPKRSIDTGSGLERVAVVLQDVDSAYETDLLRPMVEAAESMSGRTYGKDERDDVSLKVIAEHGRATTFLIADGVQPDNTGRGYILRRMLRRMLQHANRLGIEQVTERLVETTAETLGQAYPELLENRAFILKVAAGEEDRFKQTLRRGLERLEDELPRSRATGRVSGDFAFRLHDTHGVPLDLLRDLAIDEGLEVDVDRFDALMREQQERAKAAAKREDLADEAVASAVTRAGRTEFVGYERLEDDAEVVAVLAGGSDAEAAAEGEEVRLVLARTPFYAEGGGQIGDQGTISTPSGLVRISDTRVAPGDVILHHGVVESGEVRRGEAARAEVDHERRAATARSHTATHVVHWTLKHVLGEHARQAGSWVGPGRLRFDFTHHSAVPRDKLEEAELVANEHLAGDDPVKAFETTFEEARRLGAVALFGERYGDLVRVVEIGDYSRELCGGTHVPRTGKVAVVRLLHEASIGSGMRRIEALVGPDAIRHVNLERRVLEEVVSALGGGRPDEAPERVRRALERIKQLESELGRIRKGGRDELVASLADRVAQVDGVALVVSEVPGEGADGLRELAQALRGRLEPAGPGAVVLGNADGGKALLVAACTGPLVERGVTAPMLLDAAAAQIGGGAGGKPTLAFAGGRNAASLERALGDIAARLAELVGPTTRA